VAGEAVASYRLCNNLVMISTNSRVTSVWVKVSHVTDNIESTENLNR
jgi:hypothetical protein